jgi:ATP-binding cassette subfamily B protein
MLAMALMAAGIVVVSLAAGFAVRSRLAGNGLPPARAPQAWPPVPGKWGPLARSLLGPERRVLILTIWLMLLDTALALAAPLPLMLVVDHGLSHHPYPAWLSMLAGLSPVALALVAATAGLALLAASATVGYLVTFLMGAVSERMTWRLRSGVLSHLLQVPPYRAAAFPLGELTRRLGTDTADVAGTVADYTETVIPDLAVLAGMIAVTAFLDWRLTLIVLGVIPLYAVTAKRRNRSVAGASQVARARSGELASLAADLLARIPVVHVFDRGDAEAAGYRHASARAAAASIAAMDASARFSPITDTLPGLGLAGALIAGTVEVASGRLTVGGLLVLLAYLSSLIGPVQSLARLSTTVARGTASKDRIAELLCLPLLEPAVRQDPAVSARPLMPQLHAIRSPVPGRVPAMDHSAGPGPVPSRPGARALPGRRGPAPQRRRAGLAMALTNVSYAHRPGQRVLCGVSLRVSPGEVLCLTGPSGAGKSTLLSLLVRLADPQEGLITIGGRDITGMPLRTLRRLVTLVPQDPWLHTGSIADNIAYGRPGATRAEVETAANNAGVASFAADLPDGYGTQVGEHGRQLSGGQQRRIAIARALLRDTPVLLLDEPTAGLDGATESLLLGGLSVSSRGKTVILATHQARLAALADRVVTLDRGVLTSSARDPVAGPTAAARSSGPARLLALSAAECRP